MEQIVVVEEEEEEEEWVKCSFLIRDIARERKIVAVDQRTSIISEEYAIRLLALRTIGSAAGGQLPRGGDAPRTV
ncbi:hypothetical protein ACHAXT_011302 [Thalassiosira profunda]